MTSPGWAAGHLPLDISLAPGRYEAWVRDKFEGLEPKALHDRAIEKWMKIREWHLAEREVWRALYKWSCMRTTYGQQRALNALRKAYAERNEKYSAAANAHFAVSPFTNKRLRRQCSKLVFELLCRHPGFFPPRH